MKLRIILYIFRIFLRHPIRIFGCLQPHRMKIIIGLAKNFGLKTLPDNIAIQIHPNNPYNYRLSLLRRPRRRFKKFTLSESKTPLVSIIIPTHNKFSYTYTCIKSIAKHINLSYEVIVADDLSTDETKNINHIIENVVHVKTEKNLHFVLNCNNASEHARGKYIFFLNNDTQVQPGSIESLVTLMENDENIGIAGAKLVYPNGVLQDAGGIIWGDGTPHNSGRGEDPGRPEYNYVRDVDYITGAALLIRKNLWETIGGFDERYVPAYYEDTDLAFAVRELGFRTVVQPKSVVVHYEGISHGKDLTKGIKKFQTVNEVNFRSKWNHVFGKFPAKYVKAYPWVLHYGHMEKVALFVDHYVPDFDKSAGSRNIFTYIKIFREIGYRVIFLADSFNADQPYTDVLSQMGIPILYSPWYNKDSISDWFLENGKYLDFVYLHRPMVSRRYIDIIKESTNAKICYHVADLHHVRLFAQYRLENDEALSEEAKRMEAIEHYLFDSADIILTVSEKEKPIIEKYVPSKPVIVAPIFCYDTPAPIDSFSDRNSILFVGDFGHPPNIDGILWFINHVMPLLPDINLVIVGSNPPESLKAHVGDKITVTGYISDKALEKLYLSSRICIMPLQYGAGVKGKTVEAMHYQVPIVSTAFGIEGLPLDGLIAALDTPEDFANGMTRFLSSDEECERAAHEYRAWMQKWYSKERVMQVTQEILSV